MRLTIVNAAVVLLLSGVTLAAVHATFRRALYASTDAELRAASRELAMAVSELGADEAAILAHVRRKAASHEERGWFIHLLTADGRSVWQSDNCPREVAAFPPAQVERSETVRQIGRFRYVRTRADHIGDEAFLARVGTYTTIVDGSLSSLMGLLAAVGCVLSLATPLVAWWLAGRATRPVAEMLHVAERLSPTQLDDRLQVRDTPDELDLLARTINRLLDSVADLIGRQERFVADAAHELRGPLAAIQGSLEVAASRSLVSGRDAGDLTDILEATRHLSKVANDLLLLAHAGAEPRPQLRSTVDLADVVARSVAMFSGVAEEKGVELGSDAASPVAVVGATPDLMRLVSNLIDNAIRFTPPGGRIDVRTAPGGSGWVLLTVADTGIGIEPHNLRRVFDRFYKSDGSRSHGESRRGGGLGLSICRVIAESCGGSISLASTPDVGTTVTVRLRDAASMPPATARSPDPPAVLQADWIGRRTD